MTATPQQSELETLRSEVKQLREELNGVNRQRIEYLQNVSHQLVAPLNAMKWHIENLTAGKVRDVERVKKVLRSVYSQATLAVHLAKNFALMSNLEADHRLTALREPLQEVNLCQVVVNLADDFQPQGWEKDVDIRVSNSSFAKAPNVLVIKPLVTQVLSNVIENAVKYASRKSEIQIEGAFDKATDMVSVSVRNSGIPLPASETQRVFDHGYRTQEAKSVYPAGTGFGLYIARKIVELHKGEIKASTDPRGQTVFTVTFPVKALEGEARQREPKDNTARGR